MDESLTDEESLHAPRARKKRIPKACGACRFSKVKCDGQRPCSRCRNLRKTCTFVERPKDANELKIEALEKELGLLRNRQPAAPSVPLAVHTWPDSTTHALPDIPIPPLPEHPVRDQESAGSAHTSPAKTFFTGGPVNPPRPAVMSSSGSPGTSWQLTGLSIGQKRKRSHFEAGNLPALDIVDAGLVTHADAQAYFGAFFSGCDRFVPVFDPGYDSMENVRCRSSLLFAAVCSIGCRVLTGADSRPCHMLSFHAQRMLNAAITSPSKATLETIQALLVRACYVTERSLLISIATRMAFEIGLPEAYDTMSARCIAKDAPRLEPSEDGLEDDATLMRKARTWLHLLVMGHILHVDAGDLPTFRFRGAARRSRILLESPFSTDMDLYLFSQVELNALRVKIYETLSPGANIEDDEILDLVRDAKIDIEVWFNDWARIYERSHRPNMPWLTPNLAVQRCWADSMAFCRAVRASGVENVDAMSHTQKTVLLMARDSLREHLDIILTEPRQYLAGLRFAMDFVWAKNAFCFLLLLKLSILLPENGDQQSNRGLVEKGRALLDELTKADGGNAEAGKTSSSSPYLQLVRVSIDKYSRALDGTPGTRSRVSPGREGGAASGQQDLESFVPEQFIFEWDFPGLTLFSSPVTEAGWFDEFLAGTLDVGGDDFYGMGWA